MFSLDLFTKLFQNEKVKKCENENSFMITLKLDRFYKVSNTGYITNKFYKDIKDTGSYILIINSYLFKGPNAIYSISKGDIMQDGVVTVLSSSADINGNTLELEWNKGEYPSLKYISKKINNSSKNLVFCINIITSF